MAYEYQRRVLADEAQQEEAFEELEVADYLVFLLAFDTYFRWLKETGQKADALFMRGGMLVKMMERDHLDKVRSIIEAGVKNPGSIKMLEAAMRYPTSAKGCSMRALKFRTVLMRGGASTIKHVFGTSIRARKEVADAIEASTSGEAPEALTKFSAITLKNKRLEQWIGHAADAAGKAVVAVNPVHEATKQVAEDADNLRDQKIVQEAARADSEQHAEAQAAQANTLARVENAATEAAAKALATIKAPDAPVTRSEATGIATAVATAVANDPKDIKNIPPAFVNKGLPLDPEQMDAALTNGKVLVAAGAGAGKSTTLVSRVAYLVDNQGVNPSKIMAVTFNKKAAIELQEKLAKKLGPERAKAVSCDTMHTIFKRFITGDSRFGIPAFGTPQEQRMMKQDLIAPPSPGQPPPRVKPSDISRCINTMWNDLRECKPETLPPGWADSVQDEAPKARKAGLYINKWAGNDVSLEQAKANARTDKEKAAAIYYEMYLGLKGDIPNWHPPVCAAKTFKTFMDKFRQGGERLGDMDDMLKIFRDILRRDPKARATVHQMFDHILIDEAQDSNTIQHQIFDSLSEHIECDDKKKSIWLVGDDRQAIYQFRGAKPELFQMHWNDGCWKPKMIRTNYRCPPEVVEAANRLIAYNDERLPVDAMPSKYKARGEASIRVKSMFDNTEAAITTIGEIRKDIDSDAKNRPEDYAVLTRTNAELNNFETACIINEIPYVRRGGHGFLDAPESKVMLGYIDLASGTDFKKMQDSLASALTKPDRGLYLTSKQVETAVKEAVDDVARYEHKDIKDVNPNILLTDRGYARKLAEYLKGPSKNKLMAKGQWLWDKVVTQLTSQLLDMGRDVHDIQTMMSAPDTKTQDLFAHILDNVKATVTQWDPNLRREVETTKSLREDISNSLKLYAPDDDDDDEETEQDTPKPELDAEGRPIVKDESPTALGPDGKPVETPNPAKGLGSIQFLYALAEPNKNDHELGILPDLASGFAKKIQRYSKLADGLRIDLKKWEKEQRDITDPKLRQEKPPAVTLTTVHSVKGLEWPNCTVVFPKGIFPLELKPKKNEPPPPPEEIKEHDISERNLAYVAVTRAAKNLSVISIPSPKEGLSPYISQLGLKEGENVPKPGVPAADEPKTASVEDSTGNADADYEIAQWPSLPPGSYDRRLP